MTQQQRSAPEYFLGLDESERARLLAQGEVHRAETEALLDRLEIPAGGRAVDFGCGPLGVLELLSRRVGPAGEVVGPDSEPRMIGFAQRSIAERGLTNVKLIQADARATGLDGDYFDLAHERLVLITLTSPQSRLATMSRDLIDPMTKGDEPAPCAVPGCNNLSLGGDIRGPGGERISQYCPFHGMPVLLYGSLDRPSSLKGLPRCKEMIEISDWRKSKFHLEERPLPQQCSEPAIANGLCISHVAAGRDSTTIVGARECIKMWEGRLSLANEPYTSDEAWQILAEIDKIRRHGTSNSLIPRNVDSAMVAEMFIAPLFFEGPGRKERVRLAFWMSPSSIGKTLDMKPRDVMYHVRHLADTGYVELDQSYELPRSLIVTHEIRFPRKAYRSWRREKFRQKYSASKYTKIRIENLPRPNERVIEPVFDGPGIIDPDHQGQVLALTERGRAELRSWEVKLANQKQQERRHRHELVLTIILIILTSLLLISAISDAPRAWQVLQDWFTH